MIVIDHYVLDETGRPVARYKHVRGPDGEAFAAWMDGRRKRYVDRFAVGESDNDRRLARNARKQEARGA
jgi:hypothetical protein